jgi:hypothetical protein
MRVEDYFANGKRWWVSLHEKGGKRHEMPAHHKLETFLDEYIRAAGIGGEPKSPSSARRAAKPGSSKARPCTALMPTDDPAARRRARHEGQDRLQSVSGDGDHWLTWRQVARLRMPRRWPRMKACARGNSMIAPGMRLPSMRSSGSRFDHYDAKRAGEKKADHKTKAHYHDRMAA